MRLQSAKLFAQHRLGGWGAIAALCRVFKPNLLFRMLGGDGDASANGRTPALQNLYCGLCRVRMLSSAIVAQCAPVLTSVPARANNTQDLRKSRMMGAIHTHTHPRLCAQKKNHNERHTRKVKSVHISRLYEICPALTAAQRAQTSIARCTRRRRPAR